MWTEFQVPSFREQEESLYEVLGVSILATEEEIKCAWKKKALLLHPDRQSGGDTEAFQALQHAYEVLRDQTLRAEYDKELLHRLYLEEYLQRFRDLILTTSGLELPLEREASGCSPAGCAPKRLGFAVGLVQ